MMRSYIIIVERGLESVRMVDFACGRWMDALLKIDPAFA